MLPPVAALWIAIRILVEFVFPFPFFLKASVANLLEFPPFIPFRKKFGNLFCFAQSPKSQNESRPEFNPRLSDALNSKHSIFSRLSLRRWNSLQ